MLQNDEGQKKNIYKMMGARTPQKWNLYKMIRAMFPYLLYRMTAPRKQI